MWNPFKKKPKEDHPGNYDWTFQFVRGGFAINDALRRDKRYRAIVWLGGLNLKLIWVRKGSEVAFFNSDPVEYSTRFRFDPELLNIDENNRSYEYYDCLNCHGSGCDICGGTGKGIHEVKKPKHD